MAVDNTDGNSRANKSTEEPTRWQKALTFFRLLLCTEPTWLDVTLMVAGFIFAIAAGVPYPLIAIQFGRLVDNLNGAACDVQSNIDATEYQGTIASVLTQLVAIAAAQFVLVYLHSVCWNIQSQRLMHRLRDRYLRHLLRQEPGFFDNKHAGELSARLDEEFTAIQTGTSEKVGRLIGQLSFFVTAYIVAFIRQPVLAGILVSLVPAFLLLTVAGSYYFKRFAGKSAVSFAAGGSIASEALSHISVVQAFGAGPRLEAKFSRHMALARKFGIKKALVAGVQAGLLYFISYSSNALAYWQGSRMIADSLNGKGSATFGQIYSVVFLLVDACIIIGGLAPLFPIFGAASSAYERIKADMDHRSSIECDTGINLPWDTAGRIELRDVSFSYPSRPETLALKNVDLTFEPGKYTAIVGQSGSGKSTIAALLGRLYNPIDGEMFFDGAEYKSLNVRNLRGFVSLVQQESELFDRSIFENIALGLVNSPRPEHESLRSVVAGNELQNFVSSCKDDLLNEAARTGGAIAEVAVLVQKAANLADLSFIDRLEQGYSTRVGVGGKLVSGGQRQRIALARALIRDPKILVLDEATASLDSATEKRIQAAIDRVALDSSRTIVSIAHRLSTIKHADNVIVMQDGEVVEQGTYHELLEKGGAFTRLATLQGLDKSTGKTSSEISSLNTTDVESLSDINEKSGSILSDTTKEVESEKTDLVQVNIQGASNTAAPGGIDDALPSKAIISGINKLIRPDYSWFVLAVPAAVVVGCTFTAMGLIFGHTVSALSACNATISDILYYGRFFGGLVFMLAVVEFFANLGSWSAFGRLSENLVYRIRVLSFRTLMEQSVEWHSSGSRLGVITKDGASLAAFSGSIIATTFSIVINFFVAIIVSHAFAWKIAIVGLALVPLLLAAGILQVRATSRHLERSHKAFVDAIGITVEAVNQIKTIASFSLEDEVVNRYRSALEGPRATMIRESLHTCIYLSISTSTGFFIYALSYWWGSQLIIRGEYDQTKFYVVQVSLLVSASLWGQMFSLAPEFARAKSAASRTLSLIKLGSDKRLAKPSEILGAKDDKENRDIEAEAESKPSWAKSTSSKGVSVAFRDVHFAYPSRQDQPILRGLSFAIQPGQFVGLVGPSGAGKSTIMGLIERQYSPQNGQIEVAGINIAANDSTNFRDNIAVVPQDNALFNGSIKFNVGLGARPGHEATDAEIEEACRTANIHDTIMGLPQGYDTECGPNGSRLSGGQRQRLSIARALVRQPSLLLLDESTSALDAESERAVQVGLEKIARRITVIAITHRLHTVQKADVIFMIEGGKILDKGNHGELMERNESYRINALQQMLQ
ncbi:leptomycin B resistance protein pmd1 [Annulohypoxylon maeteangense]|uniref:leptomycin B resistance protein pmd1 n=1 Tax=Annulohypoxylon maeteangense TaxID=1927788 RepID=UPI002008D575|nr:leptomycin B resistance protein pmd1 [Annulohypoxylon maeteangense]KAI0890753.1 leptomycin B resistance protein pmd1 [Annulohypoxylon maeteangense]